MRSTHAASRIGSLGPLKVLVIGAVLLWALGTAWLVWTLQRPPVDLALLDQLRPGMSPQEVHEILGAPRSKQDAEWVYSRSLSWPIVYVYFDEDRRFHRSRYDR